jgi:hypothetical protein
MLVKRTSKNQIIPPKAMQYESNCSISALLSTRGSFAWLRDA